MKEGNIKLELKKNQREGRKEKNRNRRASSRFIINGSGLSSTTPLEA
jgi:hypothetical protein